MKFLDSLTLQIKLIMLYIVTFFAVILITTIGYMYISSMKKNLDSLYFGSLMPVVDLNRILDAYSNGIHSNIHNLHSGSITVNTASSAISNNLQLIDSLWKNYSTTYKSDEEKPFISKTSIQINRLSNALHNALVKLNSGLKLESKSVNYITTHIQRTRFSIDSLIIYEVEIAGENRKKLLDTYNDTINHFFIVMGVIIVLVLIITLAIFRSIHTAQTKLQETTEQLESANEKLAELSLTDEMTGLGNRRDFNIIYENEFNRSKRLKDSSITFMMLDIDYFKLYNDEYGHMDGDDALVAVAHTLKETLSRSTDHIFRMGGEEFGVLLCDVSEETSKELAQEICNELVAKEIPHKQNKVSEFVTISIGLAYTKVDENTDPQQFIQKADDALYEAKESGRNKYSLYSEATEKEEEIAEEKSEIE
ncbi:MAG: diguanylate cyclase [Helicobacteraceae bacterium]|nr:diguanylate cyclase [Helicobacteraceae bacterium]